MACRIVLPRRGAQAPRKADRVAAPLSVLSAFYAYAFRSSRAAFRIAFTAFRTSSPSSFG